MAALWGVGNHGGNPSRKDFAAKIIGYYLNFNNAQNLCKQGV